MRTYLWTGYAKRGERMLDRLAEQGISEPVLQAMAQVPRHLFVEEALRTHAYDEMSLPLGAEQNLSEPYTIAKMLELLCQNRPQNMNRVLDIGTGSGYQAGLLQALGVADVCSMERVAHLHEQAKLNLREAGVGSRVRLVLRDGSEGWPEKGAQFDGIILSCAVPQAPLALLQQLAIGGRMIVPINQQNGQYLWQIDKTAQGFQEKCWLPSRFSSLINGIKTP